MVTSLARVLIGLSEGRYKSFTGGDGVSRPLRAKGYDTFHFPLREPMSQMWLSGGRVCFVLFGAALKINILTVLEWSSSLSYSVQECLVKIKTPKCVLKLNFKCAALWLFFSSCVLFIFSSSIRIKTTVKSHLTHWKSVHPQNVSGSQMHSHRSKNLQWIDSHQVKADQSRHIPMLWSQ